MKIQVASNVTVNPETLNKIVNEREVNMPRVPIHSASEAVENAKERDNSLEKLEELQRQVDQTNKLFEVNYTTVHFNLHDDTDRYFIQIIDRKTEEVIREIPSEDFLNMVSKMVEYMGFMIDEKA
ncbi:flagellar protein FlaG [Jeotgalibacillus soli]|nr:flagellar protein FlaG [Jeotgalibacillus soli]